MKSSNTKGSLIGQTILLCLLVWTVLYNLIVKDHSPTEAVLRIVDTLTEDLVVTSFVSVALAVGVVLCFLLTNFYTQLLTELGSFRILEKVIVEETKSDNLTLLINRVFRFAEEPKPRFVFPIRMNSVLISSSLYYAMSLIFLVFISEGMYLIFVLVEPELPLTMQTVELIPRLALSVPLSIRFMAYLEYPYIKNFSSFLPFAMVVLLIIVSMNYVYSIEGNKMLVQHMFESQVFFRTYMRNVLLLAFIPVFSEAIFWMFRSYREEGTRT